MLASPVSAKAGAIAQGLGMLWLSSQSNKRRLAIALGEDVDGAPASALSFSPSSSVYVTTQERYFEVMRVGRQRLPRRYFWSPY